MLEAGDIVAVNGCMTECKDSDGVFYDVPIFVLNYPVEFWSKKPKKPKKKIPVEDVVSIKMRRAGVPEDKEITIESDLRV